MRRGERVALALVAVYCAAYAAWTVCHWGGHRVLVSDVGSWPVLGGAVILGARRAIEATDRLRRVWWCLAAGAACWLLGDVAWFFLEVVRHTYPFPSVADPFYLAFYPLTFLGLTLMPVQRRRARDRLTLVLDTATMMVASTMTVWYMVIEPTLATGSGSWLSQALAVAYPVGDLILLLAIARVMVRHPAPEMRTVVHLLGVGIAGMVVADVAFARLSLSGRSDPARGRMRSMCSLVSS